MSNKNRGNDDLTGGAAEASTRIVTMPAAGLARDVLNAIDAAAGGELRFERETVADAASGTDYTFGETGRDYSGSDAVFRLADDVNAAAQAEKAAAVVLESWITFELGGERFGLPIDYVTEIVRVGRISRVPDAPRAIRGVTNLRGRVVPVVDLRARLWMDPGDVTELSRLVVTTVLGRAIALLVDGKCELHRLDPRRVELPPADVLTSASVYILGVVQGEDGLLMLLDADTVLLLGSAQIESQAALS